MPRQLNWDHPRGIHAPGWAPEVHRSPDSVLMPFGRYKGKPIAEIPWGYLGWMMDHPENHQPRVVVMVKVEMFRRLRELHDEK